MMINLKFEVRDTTSVSKEAFSAISDIIQSMEKAHPEQKVNVEIRFIGLNS